MGRGRCAPLGRATPGPSIGLDRGLDSGSGRDHGRRGCRRLRRRGSGQGARRPGHAAPGQGAGQHVRLLDQQDGSGGAGHEAGCQAQPPARIAHQACAARCRCRRGFPRLAALAQLAVLGVGAFEPLDFPLFGRDPLVVLLAAHRIGQDVVGRIDDRHDAGGFLVARILVGMVFLAQRLVRSTNDFLGRVTRHLQVVIVCVNLGHGVSNLPADACH